MEQRPHLLTVIAEEDNIPGIRILKRNLTVTIPDSDINIPGPLPLLLRLTDGIDINTQGPALRVEQQFLQRGEMMIQICG